MADLFSPYTFRTGTVVANRVALAPLTNGQSHPDGALSDVEQAWLMRRATGGFGVITTCAAHVAIDGKGWPGELGVDRDSFVPRLSELAAAIRGAGSLPVVQLFHGGARAPSAVTGTQPWSASAFHEDVAGFEAPRAATEEDIERTIEAFAAAAARCQRAGFGGVELHGAHGYLLSQFLSTAMNQRSDRWGGDLVGRARFIRAVVRAVRARVSAGFVVGVRLSPEDFGQARGLDLDESLTVARWLCDDGADFIHASLWRVERNTTKRPDQHPIPLFRAACPADVAVVVAGAMWTRADAQAALDHGADLVALGRAAIVNPDWPREALDPAWQPRRPPLTVAELEARAVSPRFAEYLRRWKGFVAD